MLWRSNMLTSKRFARQARTYVLKWDMEQQVPPSGLPWFGSAIQSQLEKPDMLWLFKF
jgi:hypothetical protein